MTRVPETRPDTGGAPSVATVTPALRGERPDAAPPDLPARRRPRKAGRGQDRMAIVLFLLPAGVLFGLMVLAPIGIAAVTSLYYWDGLTEPRFIGIDNFVRLLTDPLEAPIFRGDLVRHLILIALTLTLQLPLALALALLLNQRLAGRAVFRVIFFLPYILSEAITAVLFLLMFSPNLGITNQLIQVLGIDRGSVLWLAQPFAEPSAVLYALFFVMTWKYFGFYMILYLAARQNIPHELTEAAQIDGASEWQVFRYVTLPLLAPTIRITGFLAVIGTIKLFDLIWIMTSGGPLHASETMAITMFRHGFVRHEIGYAAAISVVIFLISLAFALSYQRFVLKRDLAGAITGMREQR
jgi:raffinose/stachyose/melibiose transport system permease protein